jgi:hypothetical protein
MGSPDVFCHLSDVGRSDRFATTRPGDAQVGRAALALLPKRAPSPLSRGARQVGAGRTVKGPGPSTDGHASESNGLGPGGGVQK